MRNRFGRALALAATALLESVGGVAGAQSDRVRLVEDLRIADGRGLFRFGSVPAIAPTSDGGIVASVCNSQSESSVCRLALFDSSGWVRWVAAGPSSVVGLAVSDDTIAAHVQADSPRVDFYRIASPTRIRTVEVRESPGRVSRLIGLVGGAPLMAFEVGEEFRGSGREPLRYRRIELVRLVRGREEAIASYVDSSPRAIVTAPRGYKLAVPLPWLPRASVAASSTELFIAPGLAYSIGALALNGGARREIRIAAPSVPLTAAVHAEWFREWRKGLGRIVPDSQVESVLNMPPPRQRPTIMAIFPARDGRIAVVRADLAPRPWARRDTSWIDIIASDGTLRGSAPLPPGEQLRAFTGDYLYAITNPSASGEHAAIIRYRWELPRR